MKKLPHGALTYRGGTCPSPPLPPGAARGGRTGPPAVGRGSGGRRSLAGRGALGAVGKARRLWARERWSVGCMVSGQQGQGWCLAVHLGRAGKRQDKRHQGAANRLRTGISTHQLVLYPGCNQSLQGRLGGSPRHHHGLVAKKPRL
jgi:hypothetical protein